MLGVLAIDARESRSEVEAEAGMSRSLLNFVERALPGSESKRL